MKARTSLVTSMLALGLMTLSSATLANTASGSFSGTDTAAEPISASFSVTTGAGTVDVILTNTQTDPKSLGAMLSDINFTLSSGNDVPLTLVSGTGSTVTCSDGSGPCAAGGTAKQWGIEGTGGSYHLFGAGVPGVVPGATMIIGPTTANYCNPGCPDGTAQSNFKTYFQNSVEFLLTIGGVTADTTISNVSLSFGTAGETHLVPIPAALWLFGSGLLGLIGIARRRISASNSLVAA